MALSGLQGQRTNKQVNNLEHVRHAMLATDLEWCKIDEMVLEEVEGEEAEAERGEEEGEGVGGRGPQLGETVSRLY